MLYKAMVLVMLVGFLPMFAWAHATQEKVLVAVVTDNQGIETEIQNAVFYWVEERSETSFVSHELHRLQGRRGGTLNNIPFERIRQIGTRSLGPDGIGVVVTLSNGKSGECVLGIPGSLRGESDFGQAHVSVKVVAKVVMK